MNKKVWMLVLVLAAVLLLTSISLVAAQPGTHGVIACDLDITYDGTHWSGEIFGEGCEIKGAIEFYAVPEEYDCPPGNTMHFVETFIIMPDAGGSIEGKNWGIWNMHNGKFRAHGWVLDTDGYPELLGSQYHEMGVTSTTDVTQIPIYAPDGKMKMVPGNRPVDSVGKTVPQHPCFP